MLCVRSQPLFVALLVAGFITVSPRVGSAQFEFLRGLFGGRQPAAFQGDALLDQARSEAKRGDVRKSLLLVKQAMQEGAAQEAMGDPIANLVAPKLVELSRLWDERQAPPELVAETLRDIVFPPQQAGQVFPYPMAWQMDLQPWTLARSGLRIASPKSVAAELVRWSVRAQQTDALRQRLQMCLDSPKNKGPALVVAALVALAEQDAKRATSHLSALSDLNRESAAGPLLEWSCHAVAAAIHSDEASPAGLALFETILERAGAPQPPAVGLAANVIDRINQVSAWHRLLAAQLHARAGRPADCLRLTKAALARPAAHQRYGAEFAELLQRTLILQAAATLLDAGLVAEALEALVPVSDGPEPRAFMYYERINVAALLSRELHKLPAAARYDLLRPWALSTAERAALRDLSDFVPQDLGNASHAAGILRDMYSTSWHLLVTARELGKLDELIQDLAAIAPPTPQTQTLHALALVVRDGSADAARGQPTAERLKALLEATTAIVPKWEDRNKAAFPMLTLVVAAEAARHPQWQAVAEELLAKLIEHTQRLQWDRPRAHARMAWAEVVRQRAGGANPGPDGTLADAWSTLHPKLWIESGSETAAQHAGGSLPGVWLAHDDYLLHLTGPYDSSLFFACPLTGKFEISLEGREGDWSEGSTGYGGAVFAVNGYNDHAPLRGEGRSGYVPGPSLANLLHKSPWNRHTIQVDDGVVRYLANGQLVHEDHPGSSAPWFCLSSDWGRTPAFRNLRLTGSPVIPRDVALLTDARLRGWVASYYEESRSDPLQPLRVGQASSLTNQAGSLIYTPDSESQATTGLDWSLEQGELRSSRRDSFLARAIPSWLYYQRPLRENDTLRYEFFYRAGQVEAHPTIGRWSFLLDADGVTPQRLTDGLWDVLGTRSDREVPEAQKLPLQENDWNTVVIAMHEAEVQISLNGKLVVRKPLGPHESRAFGFYHDAGQTALRVRNAVLSGDWPEKLDDKLREAFERPQPASPPPDRRFVTKLMSEERFSDNAYEIYRQALSLPAQPRYDFLYQWVMPGATHDHLRLAGSFTPTHPAPPTLADNPIDMAMLEARLPRDQRRVQTGGNFVCPAILLVLSAAELNRLDALGDAVYKLDPKTSPALARSRAALLGIIGLLQDRPEETVDALWECNRLLLEPLQQEQHMRWGDVALASLAMQHPATRQATYELLDQIQRKQLNANKPGTAEYMRFARQLHGQVHYLLYGGEAAEFGTSPRLTQWRTTAQPTAQSRGLGMPIGAFDAITGELALRGGHDLDVAYFQSPLRGNYEFRARVSVHDYREAMPMAAGFASSLKYTGQDIKLHHVRVKFPDIPTPAPITPRYKSWIDYRIVVRDGHLTNYIGDQTIFETDLPAQHDPWVGVIGWAGYSARAARNLVITGQPEIPRELDLLASPDLRGWMVDYFAQVGQASSLTNQAGSLIYVIGQTPYPWRTEDGVLMCDQTTAPNRTGATGTSRLKIENILRYHRPLFEDGEVSYEFFYDPATKVPVAPDPNRPVFGGQNVPQQFVAGQTLVHPALDRLVCLLEPDGVKVHWLTDGRWDRTGLSPGNANREPDRGPSRLPLKLRDWNDVKLSVAGDTLTIALNGEGVFTRPIEPTNLRHFGLFHFVNESSVRVRNIRYRGDWPKTLPPVEQQELAIGPERFAKIPDAELPDSWDYDFVGNKFDPTQFNYHWKAAVAAQYIRPTAEGLRMTFPPNEEKGDKIAGVHPKLRISGDFMATLEYTGLKTTPVKESWGSGLSFKVNLDGSYETGIEARQYAATSWTNAIWQFQSPIKQHIHNSESIPRFPESGRLRLARRGPVLYYLFAPTDADGRQMGEFQLITQRPVGTHDVKQINLQVDCSDKVGGADVVVKSLSLRAKKIVPVK